MPKKKVLTLLDKARAKTKKGNDKEKMRVNGKDVSLSLLRSGKRGIVLDGIIYPIAKAMEGTWSLLQSATSRNNLDIFNSVIDMVREVQTPEGKKKAYLTAMGKYIPPRVAELMYDYANEKFSVPKDQTGINLYRNQDVSHLYGKAPTHSAMVEIEDKKDSKEQLAIKEDRKTEKQFKEDHADGAINTVAEVKRAIARGASEITKSDGQYKTVNDPNAEIHLRSRYYNPTKHDKDKKFEKIKGKYIRASKLARGEFGYVFRGKIFPMWKFDHLGSASNTWSMVERRMTNQERELFKRMKDLDTEDAFSLYFKFMNDVQNIPTEVITRGLELANNKKTAVMVKKLENEIEKEYNLDYGFNINYEIGTADQGLFDSVKETFEIVATNLANTFLGTKLTKRRTELGNEEYKKLTMGEEEIKKLFDTIDFYEKRKEAQPRLTDSELSNNIQVEREMMEDAPQHQKDQDKDEELQVFDVDSGGNIIEERAKEDDKSKVLAEAEEIIAQPSQRQPRQQYEEQDPATQRERRMDEARAAPEEPADAWRALEGQPPPPQQPPQNIQMQISEGSNVGDRQAALDKAKAEAEGKSEELEKDNIPDISRHGHQVAIQNVFIKNGKDFTFIKGQLAKNKYLNNPNKNVKREIDLIYAYYSTLFPITAPKEYSKGNCFELKALEFQYKRNIQFERNWKKSLAMGGGQGGQRGQNMGLIINTEGMNMNAGEFFQQGGAPPADGAEAIVPLNNQNKILKDSTGGNEAPTPDIKEKPYIPKPQNIFPKSNRKKKNRVKFQDVQLNIRQRQIKPNLLFTNPKIEQTPPQPMGDLPRFNRRQRKNNRRRY